MSEVKVRERLQSILDPKPEDYYAHLVWQLFIKGTINLQVDPEKDELKIGLTPVGEKYAEGILKELQT